MVNYPLSSGTIAIVKASIPTLKSQGLEIVIGMYDRLFQDETVKAIFTHANQGKFNEELPQIVTMALLGYAENIDNLAVLAPALERISQKHVQMGIQPAHYPLVATALLDSIKTALGDQATEEIMTAWGEAYWFLANALISREKELYANSRHRE